MLLGESLAHSEVKLFSSNKISCICRQTWLHGCINMVAYLYDYRVTWQKNQPIWPETKGAKKSPKNVTPATHQSKRIQFKTLNDDTWKMLSPNKGKIKVSISKSRKSKYILYNINTHGFRWSHELFRYTLYSV